MAKRHPNPENRLLRLNNSTRWTMRNEAADLKFKALEDKLSLLDGPLALEIWKTIYTPKQRNAMAFLGEQALEYKGYFTVSHANKVKERYRKAYEISHELCEIHFPEGVYLPIFTADRQLSMNHDKQRLMRNPRLYKALKIHCQKWAVAKRNREIYTSAVREFLRQCKSASQVLELKPEAYYWFPEQETCTDVPVADLAAKI